MKRFYDHFLAVLEERCPDKPKRVNALVELLHLEKESIYRRLRKDVYFSAEEMMRIAGAWNISLDSIVSANPGKTHSFHLCMMEYVDPTEEDYVLLEQHNRDMALVGSDPKGFAIEIVNALPRGLYARSEALTRFFTLKWQHKFAPENTLTFSEIHIPDRMRTLDLEYIRLSHGISEMHSIHDPRLIENLVNEIVYYRSIGLLAPEDIVLLRDELLTLIDYIENVTLTGHFPDAAGKMFFYLSHTWIETEYLLYHSKPFKLSLIKVMERNYLASPDEKALRRFLKMALAGKRMSVLMSESNALQQAEFFTRQRQTIRSL